MNSYRYHNLFLNRSRAAFDYRSGRPEPVEWADGRLPELLQKFSISVADRPGSAWEGVSLVKGYGSSTETIHEC